MFKKVASDVLGLSDVGKVIKPEDYDKVDADDYVMHEDNEKIYFLIKSKADEYCFTNRALIHLDGISAASKKRTLRRFDYRHHKITSVVLETAGNVDLDVEIKFTIGNINYSIDVHKQYIEELKDLYKALLQIAEINLDNEVSLGHAKESLQIASRTLAQASRDERDKVEQFKEINQYAFSWLMNATSKYDIKDFGFVFEKFINN